MLNYSFYVYITTNPNKTVLYTGVTNDIQRRISEHYQNKGMKKSFTGRYFCYNLIWYEHFTDVDCAIAREKEIKGWRREKKEKLIAATNPRWDSIIPESIE